MKLLNTGKAEILCIGMSEGLAPINIGHNAEGYSLWYRSGFRIIGYHLNIQNPERFKYKIIGFASELTEEQCNPLFKHKDGYGRSFELPKPNDRAAYFSSVTALKDFLVANKMYSENPFGTSKPNERDIADYPSVDAFISAEKEWLQAEKNTGKWLIIKAEKI